MPRRDRPPMTDEELDRIVDILDNIGLIAQVAPRTYDVDTAWAEYGTTDDYMDRVSDLGR